MWNDQLLLAYNLQIADAGYDSYNNYGRTEEVYECEDCTNCPYKQDCCPKAKDNRTIQ